MGRCLFLFTFSYFLYFILGGRTSVHCFARRELVVQRKIVKIETSLMFGAMACPEGQVCEEEKGQPGLMAPSKGQKWKMTTNDYGKVWSSHMIGNQKRRGLKKGGIFRSLQTRV